MKQKIVSMYFWAKHCDLTDDTVLVFFDATDAVLQGDLSDISNAVTKAIYKL